MNRSCPVSSGVFRASRASIKFLSEAFAVWCDQKSRVAAARAMGVLDDESHDALVEAYTRTRELVGALIARAEGLRAAEAAQSAALPKALAERWIPGGPASGGPQPEERMAAGRKACPAC